MEIFNDTYCVYIHTNKANNKMYIGQTKNGNDPNKRWANGNGYRYCCRFWNAIQKYGWDNFKHEVIASNLTLDEANHFEELLISMLDTTNPENGYNLKSGGENNLCSEETKRKISEATIGREPWNKGVSLFGEQNNFYGKKHTDDTKEKISNAAKLRTGDKNPFYGKRHSDDAKRKIAEARYGVDNTPKEAREKMYKRVNQYSMDGVYIQTYDSLGEAAIAVGTTRQNISMVIRKKMLTAKGYLWFEVSDPTQPDKTKIITKQND